MSDDWDADGFDVDKGFPTAAATDKWEGEDEDDVKDNWDEDSEEENEPVVQAGPVKKSRRKLEDIIKEKEEKRRQELEAKRKAEEEERLRMTPEEIAAEKLRLLRMQEESDLTIAKETFGVTNDELKGKTGVEAMNPKTGEEFQEFQKALVEIVLKHKSEAGFHAFVSGLMRDIAVGMTDAEQIRLISTSLNVVANEKSKEKKGKAKKKKTKAASNEGAYDDFVEGEYAEFEDFM